ncbi:MAG: hypothetical protein IIB80_09910 [Thaumarchaeota archaeon]|nr:hypothetical protein [Nitrososphaerota archaeon]
MKKWKNIKIEEQLMKDIEKVKNEKPEEFKSKSKFLEDAVNEKLKRIRDDDMRYNFTAIQEFLQKNAVTLRRKGINNMVDLTSQTLSNSEDIKKLESKIEVIDKKVKEEKKWNDEIHRMAMQYEKEDPEGAKKVLVKYMEKELSDLKKGIRKQN